MDDEADPVGDGVCDCEQQKRDIMTVTRESSLAMQMRTEGRKEEGMAQKVRSHRWMQICMRRRALIGRICVTADCESRV